LDAAARRLAATSSLRAATPGRLSNASGAFRVQVVGNFSQTSLSSADAFLLAVKHELHLWLGSHTSPPLLVVARLLAVQYVAEANVARQHQPAGRRAGAARVC
jgi:hypothetical protein